MPFKDFKIEDLKKSLAAQNVGWGAEENRFTKMSAADRKYYLGYVPGPGEKSLPERDMLAKKGLGAFLAAKKLKKLVGYPGSYDWRDAGGRNLMTAIKDQGHCGSCVAFGTVAALEAMFRIQNDDPDLAIDLSEADLFFCDAQNEGRNCDNGWWPSNALDACRNNGIVDEDCFPYTDHNQKCNLCTGTDLTKINGWHDIDSVTGMKQWLSTRGPLVTGYTVYDDFYAYKDGIYRHVRGGMAGGHCVCCVGYNDDAQYWVCKNSWGPDWGDGGYFKIAYGECGIDSTMWAVEGVTRGQAKQAGDVTIRA